ncbi:MAG TPA: SRPBCC domain-containing protein [Caulobacteraceae bacterium]|jgi:hypothetical protein|nr:SRPBCC domain-containing protein [Caulobacteraceae bacterium]
MNNRVEYRIGINVTPTRLWEVLADLDHWHGWNPMYPQASGKIAIGGVLHLLEHLANRPDRQVEARVLDWTPEAQLVLRIKEGAFAQRMQYFEIDPLAGKDQAGCIFAAGTFFQGWNANGAAKTMGRSLKIGFGLMAEALKAKVETE